MHWLDRLAGDVLIPRRPHLRFFHGGWGDPDLLAELRAVVRTAPEELDLEPTWGAPAAERGVVVRDADFVAGARLLPAGAAAGHVRLILPERGCTRVVLLMAAWNDHGYDTRTAFARPLARRGIGTLMLDNPYFGRRRPPRTRTHPIATVADFAVMGRTAVEEGIALLRHLRDRGIPGGGEVDVLGVSGYSMGGNIAAFVASSAPFPVAVAPLAASHSPAPVLLDGVIRTAIDWEALAGPADPAAELRSFLDEISVLHFPPPPHAATAVLVAARGDGFVPPAATRALHRHWPGAELRWMREGHASLLTLRKQALAQAIVDALDRFAGAPW